jgi:hypothetical protein
VITAVCVVIAAMLLIALAWSLRALARLRSAAVPADGDVDVDAMTDKVRQWLNE